MIENKETQNQNSKMSELFVTTIADKFVESVRDLTWFLLAPPSILIVRLV